MPLNRATPGQRLPGIPADLINWTIDNRELLLSLQGQIERSHTDGGGRGHGVRVPARNETGGHLTDDFPIVRLVSPIVTPAQRAAAVRQGVRLAATSPQGGDSYWGVMQGPCRNNLSQPAVVQGLTWARVNILDTAHTAAVPSSSTTANLVSATDGEAQIVWRATATTGVQWAVIDLRGVGGASGVDHPLIYVANNTAQSWPAGSVIWPATPVNPSFDTRVLTYNGLVPQSSAVSFSVLLEPVAPGFTGLAAVTGWRWVPVQFTNASHLYAQPAAGFFDRLQSTSSPQGDGTVAVLVKPVAGTGLINCIVDLDQRGAGGGDTHFVCLVLEANAPSWDAQEGRGDAGSATIVQVIYDPQTALYVAAESVSFAQWFGKPIQIDSTKALWGMGHVDGFGNLVLDEAGCNGDEFTHGLNV